MEKYELIQKFKNQLIGNDKRSLKWFYENFCSNIKLKNNRSLNNQYFSYIMTGRGKMPDAVIEQMQRYLEEK